MKISGKFHLVVAATLLLAAGGAYSQAPTGTISGTVMDESGAVIPNVEVGIADKETGTSRAVRSDGSGIFIAPALPSGTYEVKATLTGFRTTVRQASVVIGTTTSVDMQLQIGQSKDVVVVEAASAHDLRRHQRRLDRERILQKHGWRLDLVNPPLRIPRRVRDRGGSRSVEP